MSTNTDKPYFAEFESLRATASGAQADRLLFQFRFEHLATAAEVMGDFVAAALGLMGAYRLYHFFDLGKYVIYPHPVVYEAVLVFALLFVILLDREGVYRKGSGMLRVSETERTLRVSVQSFLILLPVAVFSAHLISRWVIFLGVLLVPIAVVSEKQLMFSIVRRLHTRGRGVRKAMIYGSGFTGRWVRRFMPSAITASNAPR